ncbi:DUF2345 domain-containing protein, partial [Comamonas sp. NoAH]|uniref:DUF2345 domain-containing protein n=1 Tax=Comamonas halotolerans TaxID=3041496 RepID=UPI0024E14252
SEPNTERGIKLHAADGAVKVQSQQGPSQMAAQQSVTLASTTQGANVLAAKHLLLTAGGGYIRLEGGNIQIHAPGAVTFKAGSHKFVGPQASSVDQPKFLKSEPKMCELGALRADSAGGAVVPLD